MKSTTKLPGALAPVAQRLRTHEFVDGGWYITYISAVPSSESVFNGTTTLVNKSDGGRERQIFWRTKCIGDGKWSFDNTTPKMRADSSFSLNKNTDLAIRKIIGNWMNRQGFDRSAKLPKKGSSIQLEPLSPESLAPTESTSKLLMILVNRIRPNPNQPRRDFSKKDQKRMVKSMDQEGQNTPVEVVPIEGDPHHDYELVKGERRWRATKARGEPRIEAIVRPRSLISDKKKQHRWCFTGDFHQLRYSKPDIAFALMREQENGATIEELCGITGMSDAWVSNHLTLTNLRAELRKKLNRDVSRDQRLSFTIAWRLARLSKDQQMDVYEKIVKVKGSRLQLIEAKKLIGELSPDKHPGRPRKPADNVKSMMVAIPRMAADALTVSNYSPATINSLLENKVGDVVFVRGHIKMVIEKLRAFDERLRKACKEKN